MVTFNLKVVFEKPQKKKKKKKDYPVSLELYTFNFYEY